MDCSIIFDRKEGEGGVRGGGGGDLDLFINDDMTDMIRRVLGMNYCRYDYWVSS